MSYPQWWWNDIAADVEARGHDRFSADWYAAMRDLYCERFPNADRRSVENMRLMAQWAAEKEAS